MYWLLKFLKVIKYYGVRVYETTMELQSLLIMKRSVFPAYYFEEMAYSMGLVNVLIKSCEVKQQDRIMIIESFAKQVVINLYITI